MTSFTYWGTELHTVNHLYNVTFLNERCIELSIARHWIAAHGGRLDLEIGNVLSHYGQCTHNVVDRYERAAWYQQMARQWVSNIDVLDVAGSYAAVVSLSTVEHIGTDAPPFGEPAAALVALAHMRSLLASGGQMLVTWPTGVNTALDGALVAGTLGAERVCTISRRDGFELWEQDEVPTLKPYGVNSDHPFAGQWAEAVAVAEFVA